MIRAKIKLKETEASFRNKVQDALISQIRARFPNLHITIIELFKRIFSEELQKSPTYKELVSGGELAWDLGLHAGSEQKTLDLIENVWLKEYKVLKNDLFTRKAKGLFGRVKIGFIDATFSTVCNMRGVTVHIREDKEGFEEDAPWLKWLLTEGAKIHPKFRIFYFTRPIESSRSGKAIMARGGTWQINTAHGGTLEKNWITKVLVEVRERLLKEVIKILQG